MPHTTQLDIAAAFQHQHQRHDSENCSDTRSSSPVAPAYSPITPKVQPALPIGSQPAFIPPENGADFTFSVTTGPSQPEQQDKEVQLTVPPTEYIPRPPNRPFSSEDATDAIALRAAISTLQFQKKKAQEDLRKLESIKQLALEDPEYFRSELASGGLNEQRSRLGDIKAILDHQDDTDDEDDDDDDDEGSVQLGAAHDRGSYSPEIPDSQPPSHNASFVADHSKMDLDKRKQFPPIPGPQSVVRMPHVNWDKYGVVGEPLESIHAQQVRWPGSKGSGQDKGREYTVAAPYSPWLDNIENQHEHAHERRKDSAATSATPPFVSATGTISEHVMETRSRQ